MIFDEVAVVLNKETARVMARKTGISRWKIQRIASGLPFILDYNILFALEKLGYEIKLVKK